MSSVRTRIEVEAACLGALLGCTAPDHITEALDQLYDDDFCDDDGRAVLAGIRRVHVPGSQLDPKALASTLDAAGELRQPAHDLLAYLSTESTQPGALGSLVQAVRERADEERRFVRERDERARAKRLLRDTGRDLENTNLPPGLVLNHLASRIREEVSLRPSGITLLRDDEVEALERPTYLIEERLPEKGLGMLAGHPGCFKSFVGVDLVQANQTGLDSSWGEVTGNGQCVYIAGEGAFGYSTRLEAWRTHHAVANTGLILIPQPVQLADPAQAKALLDALHSIGGPIRAVVVDTFNRSMAGRSENDGKDVGPFIDTCDRIRREFDATVLWIHHLNQGGDKHRGHTSLVGDADFVYHQVKTGQNTARITCQKMKDGPEPKPFDLEFIPCAESLVVVEDRSHETRDSYHGEDPAAIRSLLRLLSQHDPGDGLASGAWRKVAEEVKDVSEPTFYRRLKALKNAGFVDEAKSGRARIYTVSEAGAEWLGEWVS